MSGGPLDASVTVEEVLHVVTAKRVPLAPELAGYLILEIAEHADPHGGDVEPQSVFIGEEGTVALLKPKREKPVGDAEASARALLGRLLKAGGSQTPALAAASHRKTGHGLPAFAEELEAALIPVNRAAGRRALARLAREVKRVALGVGRHTLPSSSSLRSNLEKGPAAATTPGAQPPPASPQSEPAATGASREEEPPTARSQIPGDLAKRASPSGHWSEMPTTQLSTDARPRSASETDVDSLIEQFSVSGEPGQQARALKAIAGLDPTPAPPQEMEPDRHAHVASPESDVERLLATQGAPRTSPLSPPRAPPPRPDAAPRVERQLPTQPSRAKKGAPSPANARPKRSSWLVLPLLVALGAGSYAVWRLRPDVAAAPPSRPTAGPTPEAAPTCVGTLVISEAPAHAEVLLREGQAPVEVPRMPVGARLEFVATAEGFVPKRVVIPSGASWDTGADGKPRFETAVQLDPSHAHPGTNDPWPPGEPGSAVGGDGPPGTIRVVATPRGAEVWMLGGIGPDARIEHLRCDRDIEVLVAGPTTYRKRLHVGTPDFVPEDAPAAAGGKTRVARISAK
jgi:hypothetical protein